MITAINDKEFKEILEVFQLPDSQNVDVKPFGNGHIHNTFALYIEGKGYVLQRINTIAFNSPQKLMENIARVCEFLKEKILASGGDPLRQTRNVVYTHEGKSYHTTINGSVYRIFTMIEDVHCYESANDLSLFYRCGEAFGLFQQQLSDFPTNQLYDTIENFHNTPKRLKALEIAIAEDPLSRAASVLEEIYFIREHKNICGYITERLADGRLPTRVTHNDTKLNNVLFDNNTNIPICIIDLDTVMPGSLLYDFGDSIRFGAASAPEDEQDLSKVFIRNDYYKAYLDGFLSKIGDKITKEELSSLYYGAVIITLETGIRFLTDYILGDIYFNIRYPEQNLHRARTQLELVRDMEEKQDILLQMTDIK